MSHQEHSVGCFNAVWDLLSKESRTLDEDRLMRETAHASLYHWLKREDSEPSNISIGLWQISRVYAVLGDGISSLAYAKECISASERLDSFFVAYGYEAAARAAKVAGDAEKQAEYFKKARAECDLVDDEENKKLLDSDLKELG